MSTRSSNFISPSQREKIADALGRAATARRRANGATRGLKNMLAGLARSQKEGQDAPEPLASPPPAS